MSRISLITISTLFFTLLFGCSEQVPAEQPATEVAHKEEATKDSTLTLDFSYLDTTVRPQDNFYQFACGTWLANNPIPDEESKWSSFNVLTDRNNDILHQILEKASAGKQVRGSANQLIGDYYAAYIDTVKRNEDGIAVLSHEIDLIDSISSRQELIEEVAHLHDIGVGAFWSCYVSQDAMINTKYRLHFRQGGLGLPNKDYYVNEDERSVKIRDHYQQYISTCMTAIGVEPTTKKPLDYIPYYIEEQLASFSKGPVELRDPIANYHKTASGLFNASYTSLYWDVYLSKRGIAGVDTIILGQPRFIVGLNELLEKESLEDLKTYLKWKLINAFSGSLTTELERQQFHFYSTVLRGTKVQKPLWKRGIIEVTQSAVGEALGQAFVEDNFSEDAKVKVTEMVTNITQVFEERIQELDWMGPKTKQKAKEKLVAFSKKLGFPDEWKDYSSLSISRDSYYQNVLNSNRFNIAENLSKLQQEINKKEWGMVPHMVSNSQTT